MKYYCCVGLLVMFVSLNVNAASMLRVSCYGEDVGSQVYLNDKFKGECPIDVEVNSDAVRLHVKKGNKVFDRDMRLGDGVVKKIEVDYVLSEAKATEKQRAEQELKQVLSEVQSNMVAIPGQKYEINKYEVTQFQWRVIMGDNPSRFAECGETCPVEKVSWNEVQDFITKLNQYSGRIYRLPNEQEWKNACDGASVNTYCGSNDLNSVAWHDANSEGKTHPVGKKQPNAYGLFDMTGSVWEWMSDCWREDCVEHVLRGGSWNSEPEHLKADFRNVYNAAQRRSSYGFRLARTLP